MNKHKKDFVKERKTVYEVKQERKQGIDTILSKLLEYSLEDKELMSEILKKRIIDEKRSLIFRDYQESLKNYRNGNIETGEVEDLFKDLEK
mgnify:CR=1 FL=1